MKIRDLVLSILIVALLMLSGCSQTKANNENGGPEQSTNQMLNYEEKAYLILKEEPLMKALAFTNNFHSLNCKLRDSFLEELKKEGLGSSFEVGLLYKGNTEEINQYCALQEKNLACNSIKFEEQGGNKVSVVYSRCNEDKNMQFIVDLSSSKITGEPEGLESINESTENQLEDLITGMTKQGYAEDLVRLLFYRMPDKELVTLGVKLQKSYEDSRKEIPIQITAKTILEQGVVFVLPNGVSGNLRGTIDSITTTLEENYGLKKGVTILEYSQDEIGCVADKDSDKKLGGHFVIILGDSQNNYALSCYQYDKYRELDRTHVMFNYWGQVKNSESHVALIRQDSLSEPEEGIETFYNQIKTGDSRCCT